MGRIRPLAGFLFFSSAGLSQQYIISTIAGGVLPGTPAPALTASVTPLGIAVDGSGNLYLTSGNAVFKVGRAGVMTRIAGSFLAGFSGDGGPAVAAELSAPYGLAADSAGDLFIADFGNGRVRKISPDGTIATVAAGLVAPSHLAVDSGGNLYVTEIGSGLRIRRVSPGGTQTTVAGTGNAGPPPADGTLAVDASLSADAIATDAHGNLYIADEFNRRIWLVTPDGEISARAGNGEFFGAGALGAPDGVAVDSAGNLYVADIAFHQVRKVAPDGAISTIPGYGPAPDGSTCSNIEGPHGLAVDASGNVYANELHRVRRIAPAGDVETVAGNNTDSYSGDGGPAAAAQLSSPWGVAVDSQGNLWFSDSGNRTIRRIAAGGVITTLAGDGTTPVFCGPGPSPPDMMDAPMGIALAAGNVLAASLDGRIRRIGPGGVTILASGLSIPHAAAVDSSGNVYVADTFRHRIQLVAPDGTIRTVAGTGSPGYAGDGGPAINAQLFAPTSIAIDATGGLYFADTGNNSIRRIGVDGVITMVAGTGGAGYSGDGGLATQAQLSGPQGLAIGSKGELYISDTNNSVIRKVSDGVISTIAGDGTAGYSGDGGPAAAARLNTSYAIAVDSNGNIYVADSGNRAIRVLTPSRQASAHAASTPSKDMTAPIRAEAGR
jgi:sugar lactone lactonase YvrE